MKVGSTINEAFILYDDFNQKVSGITFSISSYLNGNVYNVPVNISETSPGVYNVNFVPPQTGTIAAAFCPYTADQSHVDPPPILNPAT